METIFYIYIYQTGDNTKKDKINSEIQKKKKMKKKENDDGVFIYLFI